MQKDKLLGALGLCRRAGRLAQGFDRVLETALRGRAHLVLLASDASERTARKVQEGCEGLCPVRTARLTQAELAVLWQRPAAVLAVTDENLARLCESCLDARPCEGGAPPEKPRRAEKKPEAPAPQPQTGDAPGGTQAAGPQKRNDSKCLNVKEELIEC